ncbi:type II toxin-antitoxin system MqsA family antitoxin [Pseudomonas sp. B11D7D]|nr:type II toxin-antitoxin system MqsA family antitoxin [Pseudomonas sp. B11D7D]
MKCPVCGGAELLRDIRDMSFTYKGQSIQIDAVTADWCGACGESLTGAAESERVMRIISAFRRQADAAGNDQVRN